MTRTTDEVIDRFNRAFQERDATLLEDIIAPDCVMESVQPAPDGTRYEGYDACLDFWQALATDSATSFDLEDVVVAGDRAVIRWRYRFGEGDENSVRGVNLMHVRDGKIVEALGYAKSRA
jgi:ketosteroid isomerase-like protein